MVETGISETDYEKGLTNKELKSECFQYARMNFQGKKYRNADTGNEILVSRDGLDKWNFITKSREQIIAIKKLDIILENSKKVDRQKDKKGRQSVDGFTYFEYQMEINQKPYIAKLATRETHGTDSKYYYHYLEEIKIEPDTGMSLIW